jgi:hypothetical protein
LQHPQPVEYKGVRLDCGYRVDLLVEDKLIISGGVVNRTGYYTPQVEERRADQGDTSPRGHFPKGIHEPHGIATGGIIPRGEAQLLTYMLSLAGLVSPGTGHLVSPPG